MHNRWEEQKEKMGNLTRGKRKGEKNFIAHTPTSTHNYEPIERH
jgi:hypothetical protein